MENNIAHEERIEYLDTVRGFAALSVVVAHVIASHWAWMPSAQLAMMVFNGSDAVAMFFVLSGLVLSYKLFRNDTVITTQYYKRFALARFFRLYPAFLAMLVVYYLVEHQNESFLGLAKQTVLHNPHYFWEEALLVRDHHTLFFPDWTLGVEVAVSLLVPFMVLVARQGNGLLVCLMVASLFAGRLYISEFVLHFCLGILIAKNFDTILRFNDSTRWWYKYRWYLLPFVLFCYSLRHFFQIYPLPESVRYFMDSILYVNEFLFSGIAAALILLYIINSGKLRRFLSIGVFTYLGKVSYGVYLSHWLFTTLAMRNYDYLKLHYAQNSELLFFIGYLLITIGLSIAVGTLLYYLVERPFIRWGRRLSNS